VVRGETGVAIIDTVKEKFADDLLRRLESVARYDEITTIVLNHLEPDHSGALPELLKRAPQATVYLSSRAQMMLKALLKPSAKSRPNTPRSPPTTRRPRWPHPALPAHALPALAGHAMHLSGRRRLLFTGDMSSAAISATTGCSTTGWRFPLFLRVLLRPHHAALPRVRARCVALIEPLPTST
jgi:glyoxylase-like metal-dependent hydrolase (beta-lactamase superfamily II)